MSKRNLGSFVIWGLAIVGFLVVAGPLMRLAGSFIGLAFTLLIWMFAGALAGRLLRGEGYGPLGDIGLGLVGGVFGSMLFGLLGLGNIASIPILGPILAGSVGAIVFIYLIRLFNRDFAR
jgi:uncharacterized membrane protein YeaQ/YmgE (transglycosylase-associated protein family)